MAGTIGGVSCPVTAEKRRSTCFPAKLSNLVSRTYQITEQNGSEGNYTTEVGVLPCWVIWWSSYLVALYLYLFSSSYFASQEIYVWHEGRERPHPPTDERNILQDQTGDADSFSEIGRTIILDAFATKRELGSLEHDASINIFPCAYCMQDRQRYSGLQSSPLLLASLSGIL